MVRILKDVRLLERLQKLKTSLLSNVKKNQQTISFIDSLIEFFIRTKGLTLKQIEAFEKAETFNMNLQTGFQTKEWIDAFDDDKRQKLIICAHYYINTPYYKDISQMVLDEPNVFVPTEEQYKKLVMNKYAQKVIKSTLDKPAYIAKSIVEIKRNSGRNVPHNVLGKLAVVLQTDAAHVKSSTKGGKIYMILPFGNTHSILVEERYLKQHKQKKIKETDENKHNV